MTIGSRCSQSRICVNGCQTKLVIQLGEPVHSIFDLRFAIYDLFQCGGELSDFLGGVSRRQRHAQARLPARDGRIADGRNENVLLAQFAAASTALASSPMMSGMMALGICEFRIANFD